MRILAGLGSKSVAGFYTQEMRQGGQRKGFRYKCLNGPEGILAHTDVKGPFRVGRYGVDVAGFEKNVVPVLDYEHNDAGLFIIDEVGRMECYSEKFISTVRRLFESDRSVLATVAKKGAGFISELKNFRGIKLYELTSHKREEITAEILKRLSFLKEK
jgi:nucleoside-triphosphatase